MTVFLACSDSENRDKLNPDHQYQHDIYKEECKDQG